MKLSDFKYPLPRNLVAKFPAKPRDHSKMMVLNRADESIEDHKFYEMLDYLSKGDCLVINETKVFQARLFGKKEKTNAKIEVFLLRELNVPIYGTRLTLGFLKEKLKEHELDNTAQLQVVRPRDVVELGCFKVEFIRVTHSIVDGVGLGITTPVGRVVHTGDFNIDPTTVDGAVMDLRTCADYGAKGTLLLLSDSTHDGQGGYTFSV